MSASAMPRREFDSPLITDSAQLSSAIRKWLAGNATDAEQVALLAAGYLKIIPGSRGAIGMTAKGWHEASHPGRVSEREWKRYEVVKQPNGALYPDSPEEFNDQWFCTTCGNRTEFIGIDDHGCPGDDCDCGAQDGTSPAADPHVCVCEVSLTQPLTIVRNEDGSFDDIDYGVYTGGGHDSEIGSYDRIYCACCNQPLWIGPDADAHAHASYPPVEIPAAQQIVQILDAFDKESDEAEYTDTQKVWDIIEQVRDLALSTCPEAFVVMRNMRNEPTDDEVTP